MKVEYSVYRRDLCRVLKLLQSFILDHIIWMGGRSFIIRLCNTAACTRLPETWIRVKTEAEFPVDTGTTITVSCQEGYINTGSKIVTCNTYLYQDFQYDTEPNCLYGK